MAIQFHGSLGDWNRFGSGRLGMAAVFGSRPYFARAGDRDGVACVVDTAKEAAANR